jgi:hypothetical protein
LLVFSVALCLPQVLVGFPKTGGKHNATEKTNNMGNTDSTKNRG